MSKKNIAFIVAGAVVLLVVIGIGIVLFRIDAIVHSTVEREGSDQLHLATTLSDADVSLLGGSLTLSELAIANPEGYTASHIFNLGQVDVGVSYRQLMSEPVRIRQIDVNSPRLTIERSGAGIRDAANINLRDLLARLDTSDEEATKLIIDQLTVTNAQVVIRPGTPELREEYAITIPDLTMNEIGTGEGAQNGAEIGRIAADLAVALTQKAAESEDLPPEVRAVLSGNLEGMLRDYANKLPERAQGELQEQLGDLNEELERRIGGAATRTTGGDVEGAADDVKREAGDAVRERIDRGLGGLLGDNEDEPAPQPE